MEKLTTENKVSIGCLLFTTALIIGTVIFEQEFTWFWKMMSVVTLINWLSVISEIRKKKNKK